MTTLDTVTEWCLFAFLGLGFISLIHIINDLLAWVYKLVGWACCKRCRGEPCPRPKAFSAFNLEAEAKEEADAKEGGGLLEEVKTMHQFTWLFNKRTLPRPFQIHRFRLIKLAKIGPVSSLEAYGRGIHGGCQAVRAKYPEITNLDVALPWRELIDDVHQALKEAGPAPCIVSFNNWCCTKRDCPRWIFVHGFVSALHEIEDIHDDDEGQQHQQQQPGSPNEGGEGAGEGGGEEGVKKREKKKNEKKKAEKKTA